MNRDLHLRLEATLYLLAAQIALRLLPFRALVPYLERGVCSPELTGVAREQARREVRRAVFRAAPAIPGTACFARAIAAQAMLKRRAVSTTLYWGACTQSGGGLVAHVWLRDGDRGVAGNRQSRQYRALTTFPRAPAIDQEDAQ